MKSNTKEKLMENKIKDILSVFLPIHHIRGADWDLVVEKLKALLTSEVEKVEKGYAENVAHIAKTLKMYKDGSSVCPICGIDYKRLKALSDIGGKGK